MGNLVHDIRSGLRIITKSPGFTTATVLALALGVGANTAIFSFGNLIVRQPVSLPELNRLGSVYEVARTTEDEGISPANYLDLRAQTSSFLELAAYQHWNVALAGKGEPVEVHAVKVTPNFFAAIGTKPVLGRGFIEEESRPGNEHVAILSDSFWRTHFGQDHAVLLKTIQLDGETYSVVGVMPRAGTFPLGAPLLWVPIPITPSFETERTELSLNTVGLLRPGVTPEKARAEAQVLWRNLTERYSEANATRDIRLLSLRDRIVVDYNRQFAYLLMGVVGVVLLIACANVANLQLVRAAGRQREIAIRAALGASRWRILRQLLVESVFLALLGGGAGLLLAVWGVAALRVAMPAEVQWFCDLNAFHLDFVALVFTFVVAVIAGLLAGIAPALRYSRVDINKALKQAGASVAGGRSHRLRGAFVVAEITLTVVLLIGTALMVRGFALLVSENAGLQPDSLLTVHLNLPESRYRQPYQVRSFCDQFLARLEALPGVRSVALASGLPYSFYEDTSALSLEGQEQPAGSNQHPTAMLESVSPDYFRTLNVPVKDGRGFLPSDNTQSENVAVVSQSTARRLWPGQSALDKRMRLTASDPNSPWFVVVGTVGDIPHEVYDRSYRSVVYVPYAQMPPRSVDFAIRTTGDPHQLLDAARFVAKEIDKDQPLEQVETMSEKIRNQASGLRFVASLMAFFGGVGLVLSVVGVFAVMAYSVTERWRELGIRIALGVPPKAVLREVMRKGLVLALTGMGVGVAMTLALARVLSSLIYGVSAWDAMAFSAIPLLMMAVALIACYFPARRATTVDPMVVLHQE